MRVALKNPSAHQTKGVSPRSQLPAAPLAMGKQPAHRSLQVGTLGKEVERSHSTAVHPSSARAKTLLGQRRATEEQKKRIPRAQASTPELARALPVLLLGNGAWPGPEEVQGAASAIARQT
mmetsp:Transcript_42857/g.101753  ORF Transcript_42857/g.101753 Transcript_42857/m.101753 type:complete len:121 (+) Transcript_42857:353-715(+)